MDYDDVLLLSRTYARQRVYEHQKGQVGQLIYGRLFDAGFRSIYDNLPGLHNIISTFLYRECGLLEVAALTRLDEAYRGADSLDIPPACELMMRHASPEQR